jgi:hypothetical protein
VPLRAQLAGNTAARNAGIRTDQPSLLAGMLFDAEGNRMTPSYAVKKGTRYRYYVSRPLITKDQTERSAGLRIPAAEIEQLVTNRVRQWLLDPGGIYQSTRLPDLSAQRRLIACAAEIGNSWSELSGTRQRAVLTGLIERIDIGVDQIDIQFRPTRLAALLDVAMPLPSANDDQTLTLSVPMRLRRAGRKITMRIDSMDPFATAKPDARLIKLLIRARRFNAALVGCDGVPFAALAKREGVSRSYFTRLVRLSYLAPDITEAILDGRQPRSDHRQAAGTFTSATWLARAADRAWHCLSQTGLRAGHIANSTSLGAPVQPRWASRLARTAVLEKGPTEI